MKTSAVIAAACAVVAAAAVARAHQPVPYLPVPHDAAVILNTGSTNGLGYRIVLQRSGNAEFVHGSTRAKVAVDAALASRFFNDATHAMPLSRVRILMCMKSASFGSMTFVWWRGQRTSDISCPGDASASRLYADVGALVSAIGMRTITPGTSRNPAPAAAPTTSHL